MVAERDSLRKLWGGPAKGLLSHVRVRPGHLGGVRDDLDLPFGGVRLRRGGGHGGHNGVRDIIAQLGSRDFCQVRCGIGRPQGRQDPADFVLSRYSAAERPILTAQLSLAADLIEILAGEGIQAAQQEYHRRTEAGKARS